MCYSAYVFCSFSLCFVSGVPQSRYFLGVGSFSALQWQWRGGMLGCVALGWVDQTEQCCCCFFCLLINPNQIVLRSHLFSQWEEKMHTGESVQVFFFFFFFFPLMPVTFHVLFLSNLTTTPISLIPTPHTHLPFCFVFGCPLIVLLPPLHFATYYRSLSRS